ncbi:metal-dependent hydrolase [Methanobrevibacter sp. DSM 116169]|uniref:metal-dependent hydrolase n=1 Tax=Methanobrevibacter sp. DSM 116169 TaxID=3242727 RepID=UPI0038FCBB6F
MSSYKGHTLFALILSILYFQNPLLISLSIIGANLPDFDHKLKKDNVYKMIIFGLSLFIILYILKLPYYIGIILVIIGLIFYFSNHRGFTHSIFGLIILTSLFSGILILSFELVNSYLDISNKSLIFAILIILIGTFSLNKKLYLFFVPLFLISIFFFNIDSINYFQIILSIFLGYFSHLILDAFTPAGVKLFRPFSNKKYYKKFAITSLLILIIIGFLNLYFQFNSIENILI